MLFSTILYSFVVILEDYFVNEIDFWTIIGWLFIGMGLLSLPSAFMGKHKAHHLKPKEFLKIAFWTMIGECFTVIGYIFMLLAFVDGPVTIVNALLSLQALFVLIMSVLLGINNHEHLSEVVSKSTLFIKLFSIILLLISTFFISH